MDCLNCQSLLKWQFAMCRRGGGDFRFGWAVVPMFGVGGGLLLFGASDRQREGGDQREGSEFVIE